MIAADAAVIPLVPPGRVVPVLVAVVVTGVLGAVVLSLDGGDLRAALSRLPARTCG